MLGHLQLCLPVPLDDINKVQVMLRITNDISLETEVDRQAYLKVASDACIKEIEPLPPTQIF